MKEEIGTMQKTKRKTLSFPMLNALLADPNLDPTVMAKMTDTSSKEINLATRQKSRSDASDEEAHPVSISGSIAGSVPAHLDTLSAAPSYTQSLLDDQHNRARSWETPSASTAYNTYVMQTCANQSGISPGYLSSQESSPHIAMMAIQQHIAT